MDIGKSIQQSFDLYKNNFGTLLLAGLVAGLLSAITLGILAGPLFGGFLVLCQKLSRGEKGEVSEVFAHFDKFLPTFLVTLVVFAASLALYIIAFVPFIGWIVQLVVSPIIGLLYFLALGFVVDKNMKPFDAIKSSINVYASEPVLLWIYALIFGILSSIGAIIFFVGIILTLPFGIVGYAIAYQTLSTKETAIFNPEKKTLQIVGLSVAVLLVAGLAFFTFGSRAVSKSSAGSGFANRILSMTTGQKVNIDEDGKNFRIGNVNIGTGLPKDFPKDIPIYPNSEVGGYLSGKNNEVYGSTITFTAKDKAQVVYDYYLDKTSDWEVETSEFGDMKMLTLTKENRVVNITINPNGSKSDIVMLIATE
jgi:MFS family permease